MLFRSSPVSGDGGGGGGATRKNSRSQEDKQHMLGQYLSNVDALVQDLQETAPFENVAR